MKKSFAMFLVLSILFSLIACDRDKEITVTDESIVTTTTNDTESSIETSEVAEDSAQDITESTTSIDTTTKPALSPTIPDMTEPPITEPPSTKPSVTEPPTTKPSTTKPTSRKISFKDVEGVWYAEGHDDVTITFSIWDDKWVWVDRENLAYNCVILLHQSTGGNEYSYKNGFFTTDEITLNDNGSLVYTKKGNTLTFYRQPNYPQEKLLPHEKFLQEIDGYYWYLDGYDYTYLHPTVISNDGSKSLFWESENINIYENSLTAYEKYEYDAYQNANNGATVNTANSLWASIEFTDILIDDYKMRTDDNKLFMTVGDTTYSFTRYTAKKNVPISLVADCSSITIEEGSSFHIYITVSPFWSYRAITASSSNPSVVLVNSGDAYSMDGNVPLFFQAVGVGNATLTFSDTQTGATTSVSVIVKRTPIPVARIALNRRMLELAKGESATLVATIYPDNASDKSIVWTSSNNGVAEVSSSGVVTAKGKGSATITATSVDGGFTATCTVTVSAPAPVAGITLDKTALDLTRGKTATLVATVFPDDASNKTVVWSSSDNTIAEVSSSGVVTAKGAGSATITATSVDGGFTATCTITVIDPPLTVNASMSVGLHMSSSAIIRGVFVEVSASGGSGKYVECYIKVYFNGKLVAEGAENNIIVTVANGTYTAEVYVKDSNGNEATNTESMTLSGY